MRRPTLESDRYFLYNATLGYSLDAVIGRSADVEQFAGGVDGARAVEIGQGLALVPLVPAVVEMVALGPKPDRLLDPARRVAPPLAARLAELSRRGPIAYVEAEFFGGSGVQASLVWSGRTIVLGPLIETEETWPGGSEAAINQALRLLGVSKGQHFDEFEAVGLDRHRHTSEWLE
jgi:hypothetical protein